jgi:hypothetical protein
MAARERKASALAALFESKGATVEQVANLDDAGWDAASKLTKVRPDFRR